MPIDSDQVLEIVFTARDFFERAKQGLFKSSNLCFRRHHINRREHAFGDEPLVVFELGAGIAHGVALHLQIAQREHQVPIRALHGGDGLDGALAKLRVGQAQVLLRDLDALAVLLEPQRGIPDLASRVDDYLEGFGEDR